MNIVILDMQTFGPGITSDAIFDLGSVTIYDRTTPEQVPERIAKAEVVLTNKVSLRESSIAGAKYLKYIGETATGYDNIDIQAAKKHDVVVTNVVGYGTSGVVEHTFALYFYLAQKLAFFDAYTKEKKWCKSPLFCNFDRVTGELHAKQWGIIGMGAIGQGVAKIAQAFGARVVYHSTSGKNTDQPYKNLSLDALLKTSDVVSLHCPSNEKTRNLLDLKQLRKLSSKAFLLNVARGGIVNEFDLAQILEADKIGGVGLDVLAQEPPDDKNPLFQIKNKEKLVMTPHIAWAPQEARQRLFEMVLENLRAFQAGKIQNRVV